MVLGTGERRGPHADALVHVGRLLDLLPAGACTCTADGRLTYFSPQAAALWGRAPDLDADAPRYCGAVRLYGDDGRPLPHERSPMAQALASRQPRHGDRVQLERPDGERRVALAYASPLLHDDGSLAGGLNLLVDVTEQHRRAQAEADRLRARGEELVALACDIRAGLEPLRRGARQLARIAAPGGDAPVAELDRHLRDITRLVDRVLNLEVD